MAVFDAGSIQATLTLDREQFDDDLEAAKADVEELVNEDWIVKLLGNKDDLDETVDDAEADLDEYSARDATATLNADGDPAEDEISLVNVRMDDLDAKVATPTIGADIDPFEGEYSLVEGEMDDMDGKEAFPVLTLEDEQALGAMTLVRDDLDELTDTPHVINVEANTSEANAAIAETAAETQGMNADLAETSVQGGLAGGALDEVGTQAERDTATIGRLNNQLETVTTQYRGMAMWNQQARKEIDELQAKLSGGSGSGKGVNPLAWLTTGPDLPFLPNILGSIAGIGPTLDTVTGLVQGLAAGLGGLVTAWGVAAAGAVAFGALAYGPIEQVVKALSDGTKLKGGLGGLETAIKGLETAWNDLSKSAKGGVLTALVFAVDGLTTALPHLAPLLDEAAAGFTAFMQPLLTGLNSSGFVSFIGWLASVATPVAASFGQGFANIGAAIAGWMEAWGPFLYTIEDGITGISQDWANLSTKLVASPQWTAFLNQSMEDLLQIGTLVGNIGNAIGQMFISLGPSGPFALKSVNTILESIAKVITPLLKPLGELGKAILKDAAALLSGFSGGATETAKELAKSISNLAKDLSDAAGGFKTVGTALGDVSRKLGPLGTAMVAFLAFKGINAIPALFATNVISPLKNVGVSMTGLEGTSIGAAAASSSAWVSGAAKAVAAWLTATGTIYLNALKAAGSMVAAGATAAAGWVASAATAAGAWIAETAKADVAVAGMVLSQIGGALDVATAWMVSAAEAAGAWLASTVSMIADGAVAAAGLVADAAVVTAGWVAAEIAATAAWIAPGGWIVIAIGAVVAAVAGAVVLIVSHWSQIEAAAVVAWSAISGFAATAVGDIVGFFEKLVGDLVAVWDDISSGVSTWFASTLEPWFEALPGRIVAAIGDAGSILLGVGKDIVDGLLKGIQDAWSSVTGWLGSAISDLGGLAQSILNSGSPSLVFAQIGESIPQGLAQGILGATPLAVSATSQMATRVTSAGLAGTFSVSGGGAAGGTAWGTSRGGSPDVVAAINALSDKWEGQVRRVIRLARSGAT